MVEDKSNGWNEHAKLVLAELIRLDKNDGILTDEIKKQEQEIRRDMNEYKEQNFKDLKSLEILFITRMNDVSSKFETKLVEIASKTDERFLKNDEKFSKLDTMVQVMGGKNATIYAGISTLIAISSVVVSFVK